MVLDSGSSIDLFCNEEWLQDIKDLQDPHEVNTNAGGFKVKQEGELPNYGRLPLDKEAMTNILSVGVMSDKYRITMDTAKENAFFVHTHTQEDCQVCQEPSLPLHTYTKQNAKRKDSNCRSAQESHVCAVSGGEQDVSYSTRNQKGQDGQGHTCSLGYTQ